MVSQSSLSSDVDTPTPIRGRSYKRLTILRPEPMADQVLLAEVRREPSDIRVQAERLAGRLQALETIIERYGEDGE